MVYQSFAGYDSTDHMHYFQAKDYIHELGGSPYKSMLLNDVVLGNTVKLYDDDPTLTQVSLLMISKVHGLFWCWTNKPPAGYDSVIGEPGSSLNYDEAIGMCNAPFVYLRLVTHSFAHSLQGTAFVSFRILYDAQPADRTKRFDLSSWSSISDLEYQPPFLNTQTDIWSFVFLMYNKWNDIRIFHSNSPKLDYLPI